MNKKIVIILIVAVVVIGGSLLWRYAIQDDSKSISNVFKNEPKVEPKIPAIDGVLVSKDVANNRPIAVVIENHPDSRPQTGLDKADVVYETVAEGGITRFLAVFQSAEESALGPVRSARPYFAELASEYSAVFAHVGGSDEVLARLSAGKYAGLDDANQYFLDDYFNRIKSRLAPHNVYTKLSTLRKLIVDKKWASEANLQNWQFTDTPIAGTEPAASVSVNFSTASYAARFDYDATSGLYKRFLAGLSHNDAETKQQLSAKTVIVQLVNITSIPNDPKLRVDIDLDASGHAYVFHDGTVTHAQSKKSGNRTRYYGVEGKEIILPRGQIWVALAPNTEGSVAWK